jgi:hypothetical protein
METSFGAKLKHAWNVFLNKDPTYYTIGGGNAYRPDRPRLTRGNERSISAAVHNRIAMDAAAVDLRHVRFDENGRFLAAVDSGLNNCLAVEANAD